MYTLDITDAAEQDLDRITDYLGVTLANPQAALALLDEVEKINSELVSNPSIYPLCTAANLADLGYHKAIVNSYIAVFEIDLEANIVRIMRIFHSSENYANKL